MDRLSVRWSKAAAPALAQLAAGVRAEARQFGWFDELQPCPRCGAMVDVLSVIETTKLSDPQPTFLRVLAACPTEGCGTTCVTCRRPPGEVHGPHCWERMRDKLIDPHIVDEGDCRG